MRLFEAVQLVKDQEQSIITARGADYLQKAYAEAGIADNPKQFEATLDRLAVTSRIIGRLEGSAQDTGQQFNNGQCGATEPGAFVTDTRLANPQSNLLDGYAAAIKRGPAAAAEFYKAHRDELTAIL